MQVTRALLATDKASTRGQTEGSCCGPQAMMAATTIQYFPVDLIPASVFSICPRILRIESVHMQALITWHVLKRRGPPPWPGGGANGDIAAKKSGCGMAKGGGD